MKAYLNLKNGERQDYHVRLSEEVVEEVHAVYIDGFSNCMLNAEFGAGIEFEIQNMKRWMADYRYCEFWCRPAFGESFGEVPEETQGLVYEKEDGTFGAILSVVSENYKCVLEGVGEKSIRAKLFSWYEKLVDCKALAFVWAEGNNPFLATTKTLDFQGFIFIFKRTYTLNCSCTYVTIKHKHRSGAVTWKLEKQK